MSDDIAKNYIHGGFNPYFWFPRDTYISLKIF